MDVHDNATDAPDARDYVGQYLKKEDVPAPTIATITNVSGHRVEGERKLVVEFAEFVKPLVLNVTNIKVLSQLFGTSDTRYWRGEVTLYVDPHIEYAGRIVGGLRLRPSGNGAPRQSQRAAVSSPEGTDVPF